MIIDDHWPVPPPFGAGDHRKPDERQLWDVVSKVAAVSPRVAGVLLGIPSKRVVSLCEKWSSQGIYNYGVSPDLGWPS